MLCMCCCTSCDFWPCLLQMHVDSWFHLGVMHLNGLGVKKNLQQALNYFASAAKYGHVLAQYNLAMLHLQNSGTERRAPTATSAASSSQDRPLCVPACSDVNTVTCIAWHQFTSLDEEAGPDEGRERCWHAGMGAWLRLAG